MTEETLQEKIRNKLTPYWNLICMIENYDEMPDSKKDAIWKIIHKNCKLIQENQDSLLELINKTALK